MENTSDSFMPRPLLFCLKSERSVCYSVLDNIYGHIHNRKDGVYQYMRTLEKALNAGCMLNGYEPVTFWELVENNMVYKK